MARFAAILVIIVVIAFAVQCARGGCSFVVSSQGTPQTAVRGAIEAVPGRDINKVVAFLTGPAQVVTTERLQVLYQHFDTIKLGTVIVSLQSQQDAIAHVYLNYDLIITAGSQTTTQKIELSVQVVNLNGKWFVNEPIL